MITRDEIALMTDEQLLEEYKKLDKKDLDLEEVLKETYIRNELITRGLKIIGNTLHENKIDHDVNNYDQINNENMDKKENSTLDENENTEEQESD